MDKINLDRGGDRLAVRDLRPADHRVASKLPPEPLGVNLEVELALVEVWSPKKAACCVRRKRSRADTKARTRELGERKMAGGGRLKLTIPEMIVSLLSAST